MLFCTVDHVMLLMFVGKPETLFDYGSMLSWQFSVTREQPCYIMALRQLQMYTRRQHKISTIYCQFIHAIQNWIPQSLDMRKSTWKLLIYYKWRVRSPDKPIHWSSPWSPVLSWVRSLEPRQSSTNKWEVKSFHSPDAYLSYFSRK